LVNYFDRIDPCDAEAVEDHAGRNLQQRVGPEEPAEEPAEFYRVSAFLWSLTSAMTALAGVFGGILAARMLLGVAEGPGFPASAKATGYWFPRGERAMATSIFDAAAKLANVIGVPLVALAVVQFGWRWGFGITGVLSFLYLLAFLIVYRDPSRHPRLSATTSAPAAPHQRARRRAARSPCSDISCAIARFGD
jgi:MFS family permease